MNAKEIICKARTLLEEKWGQGAFMDSDGCMCAVGALRKAAGGSPRNGYDAWQRPGYADAIQAINRALGASTPSFDGENGVVRFNDAMTTTQEDVLNVFTKAAEALS